MPGFFFLTKAELVGAACPDTQSSGLDFKDFIQSLRLLGEAHNVTNGVLYDFLTDDRNPDQKMVLLVAQTREMNANIIFPVQFKPDGTFSNFGPPRPVKPIPWLKHIVPAEDTNATAQEAALAALEGRHVTLAF